MASVFQKRQVAPGMRDQVRQSTLESQTGDPELQIKPDAEADPRRFAPVEAAAATSQPAPAVQPAAAPAQPPAVPPVGPPSAALPQSLPAVQVEQQQQPDDGYNDPNIAKNIIMARSKVPGALAPGGTNFSIAAPQAVNAPSPDILNAGSAQQQPASPAPTPTPSATNGPDAGAASQEFITRFNKKADEIGQTENELKNNAAKISALSTERSTALPVSGKRRFGAMLAGIAEGILTKNPLAGIQAYQDVKLAPEQRRNYLLDSAIKGAERTDQATVQRLQAQKDVLGAYGTAGQQQLELMKFNAPVTELKTDPVTGETKRFVYQPHGGPILSNETVAGDPNAKLMDPSAEMLQKYPQLKGKKLTTGEFRNYLEELRVPSSQAAEPIFDQGLVVGIRKGGQTWATGDPSMPPELKIIVDAADKAHKQKLSEDLTQRSTAEQSLQGFILDRQFDHDRQMALMRNSQADDAFKNQLSGAYTTKNMIDTVRQLVAQKPYLVGPVAGRLEKTGQSVGSSFGMQNPQDEQDAARLAGHLEYLFVNELRGAVPGRTPESLQKALQDASAGLNQNPRILEGFLQSAERNANNTIQIGKDRWGIDLDTRPGITTPHVGVGGSSTATAPVATHRYNPATRKIEAIQ